jgi:hypothetical protein
MNTEPTHAELVQMYLKSEKDAQPFYEKLRKLQKKRNAFNAEVKRCRTAHPGRTISEIETYMGKEP